MSSSSSASDEFDEFDFSEFTAKDFEEIDARLARAHPHSKLQIASPISTLLSWKKHIAVTDLVSPIWCEVQYEYGLFGKRNRPLHLRPSTFTSKSGKQIHVHQQIARANDRRLQRGKSVHKALEKELRPTEFVVHVTSQEERFALRLVQLIDGFVQLVSDGITRELPVFTITHNQVVLGVIDEVLCRPRSHVIQDQTAFPSSGSPTLLPPHKKQRLISSPFSHQVTSKDSSQATSTYILDAPFELHILDHKTRRSPNIPMDEDSLSPRLQLMIYHRMLSSLLEPEAFDFDMMWNRLNLDPSAPFSAQFLKDIVWEQRQTDFTDCAVHLNRLVSEWKLTVQRRRPKIFGVSQQLQLVYRRPTFVGNRAERGKPTAAEPVDIEDPLEALLLQEELDLARAIEESLVEMGHQPVNQVAHQVSRNVEHAGPTSIDRTSATWKDLVSVADSEQNDPTLARAIQQSLLTSARGSCAQALANTLQQVKTDSDNLGSSKTQPVIDLPEGVRDETALNIPPVIGTREFTMDDAELDMYLADVLQWWLGTRPARGVNIGQTNRCFTCEYRDSCEWREQKAQEAVALAARRRAQRSNLDIDSTRSSNNSIWPTTEADTDIRMT